MGGEDLIQEHAKCLWMVFARDQSTVLNGSESKRLPGRTSKTKGWLPYKLVSALADSVSWFHMASGRAVGCRLSALLAVRSWAPNKELLASMPVLSSIYCSCNIRQASYSLMQSCQPRMILSGMEQMKAHRSMHRVLTAWSCCLKCTHSGPGRTSLQQCVTCEEAFVNGKR